MSTQAAATMPGAFLVVLGDAVILQPVGGGLGGGGAAATEYMRMNRVRDFCAPHPDDTTLFCLEQFLMMHHFAPGIFLTASRDRVG